jgi:phage-related protein
MSDAFPRAAEPFIRAERDATKPKRELAIRQWALVPVLATGFNAPPSAKGFLNLAQAGGKHQDAKVLTGFGSAGVMEVVEDNRGNTYRAVYTIKFAGWVYPLHCFQKKSKSGSKTPKEDTDLIHARLKGAKQDFDAWQAKQGAR